MKAGEICIRATCPADRAHLRALYSQAFPREDLAGLLDALLDEPAAVVSLAAWCNGELAGHAAFTLCPVEGHRGLPFLSVRSPLPRRRSDGASAAH